MTIQLNKPIGLIKIILFGNSFPGQMWGNEHPMQLLSKSCILSEENNKKIYIAKKRGGREKKIKEVWGLCILYKSTNEIDQSFRHVASCDMVLIN